MLANPTHLRAEVTRLKKDRRPVCVDHFFEGVGDLVCHPLLDAESAGEDANKAGHLAEPDDLVMGDIADPRPSDERQHVVLA